MPRLRFGRWIWVPLIVLALGGALWLYVRAEHARSLADPGRARREGLPIPVRTASAAETQVEEVVGGTAVTVPSRIAVIRMGPSRLFTLNDPVSDIVVKAVHAYEGDHVERNQLLFEVEAEVFAQVVKQRQAALATAAAELERVTQSTSFNQKIRALDLASVESEVQFRAENLEACKKTYDALTRVYKTEAATVLEYHTARTQYAQARFDQAECDRRLHRAKDAMTVGLLSDKKDLAKAANDVEIAKIDLEVAQRDAQRVQVKSPLDGFLNKFDLCAGQVVGLNTVLGDVVQLDPLYVRMDFPQDRLDEVSRGQPAEIVLDSLPRETFTGKVIRILPQANPELRVLPVIVEMKNPGNRIKAGITGFVRLRATRAVLTVPSTAVIEQDGKAMVFRVEDGRARIREIRTGHPAQPGVLEVRDGLAAGDEVVIHHNFYQDAGTFARGNGYLQDNDLVDTDWRKWARRD